MKAADFRYERPDSLSDAVALLAEADAMPLAGGQSLMPMMNFRLARPALLVDLNGIDGLSGVTVDGDHVRIGAMTRYAELDRSEVIGTRVPLLARAIPHIAHDAVRNRGTIGGSAALADPAAEMPAVLLALGATIEVTGPDGVRRIPADGFFIGMYETALGEAELVTAVEVPVAASGDRFGFYELARRHGDYAMAGVAIARRADVRIAFFSVAEAAFRATAAEALLAADAADIEGAVASLDGIDFTGDLNATPDTKKHLAGVVLRRAWTEVAQ